MRALVNRASGLTLEYDYPLPELHEGEALIRVLQVGICNTDIEIIRGYMDFQGVLGHEFVGIVEKIAGEISAEKLQYWLGRRVVGEINAACYQPYCYYCSRGMSVHCPQRTTLGIVGRDGAFAEYLTLPLANLHAVPDNVSDEEAVFVEPVAANFEIMEQVHLRPTDRVTILGDGKMGQLAAQVLTLSGCDLTMIGKHEEKLALAAKRGVVPRLLQEVEQGPMARNVDVVVECTGAAQGLEMALRMVRPRGIVILKSTVADRSNLHLAPIIIDEIRVQGSRCGPFAPALRALSQKLIDVKPLISASYSLDGALDAFERAQQKGVLKVLVRV
jgi:threonine dehydrogenase-like Zn-dependent dehydrogenase